MFEPDMTFDDLRMNMEFLQRFGLLWPVCSKMILNPLPGTPVFDTLSAQGRLKEANHSFSAVYRDPRVQEFRDVVRPVLEGASGFEFAIRRAEFDLAVISQDDAYIARRAPIETLVHRLSDYTYQFLERALTGDYSSGLYHRQIDELAGELESGFGFIRRQLTHSCERIAESPI
jgi:hypothetical protein